MLIWRKVLHPLRRATDQIERKLAPWLIGRGWRPPANRRLDAAYLEHRFGYDEEDQIKAAARKICGRTALSFERLATLWLQVRYLDRCGTHGDLVECGVFRGGAVGMMALAHMASHSQPWRRIHLFDSFEGMPAPRAEVDGAAAVREARGRGGGELISVGVAACPVEEVRIFLENELGYPASLLEYHVGWFQKTLPNDAEKIDEIALLRLDGDWYDSTRACLDYLYPKVVPNGMVVIDDYGHYEGCRKAVDEFLARLRTPPMLHQIDYTGRYWIRS